MKVLVPLIEIIICMNFLLILSYIFIKKIVFKQKLFLKLYLARLLFMSCILSPIVMQLIYLPCSNMLNARVSSSIENRSFIYSMKNKLSENINDISIAVSPTQKININHLYLMILAIFLLGIFYQINKICNNIRITKLLIGTAQLYKKRGKIIIKISDQCVIPFAIRGIRYVYIILPISILNSSIHTKLAIAHEGQHHRQGDCLWAYLIEFVRIVFWFNPFTNYWHNHFQELQELACDEILVSHNKISAYDYGSCLFAVTKTASQYSYNSYQQLVCISKMIFNHKNETSFIVKRINMLSTYKNHPISKTMRCFIIIIFSVSLIIPLTTAYATKGIIPQALSLDSIDKAFIDQKIQNIAIKELSAAVNKTHAKSGAIVIADARTGKIVAFAEIGESIKNNSWSSRIFNPASTIKPFIAAAAIDSGASLLKKYDCHDPNQIDGINFTNGDSKINSASIADALAHSVNTCMLKIAEETGSIKIRQTLSHFGFDMNVAWNNNNSDELNLAYATMGSSIPVTLKTLTNAFTILANKGLLNSKQIIPKETANKVTHLLEKVVTDGTGKRAAIDHISIAGKTGTLVNDSHTSSLALFAGYVPSISPRYVSIVVIEDAKIHGSIFNSNGGNVAAPVFHNVFENKTLVLE
jgi:beta-lactamase regulating signal transducer with metallopeptidase domain/beta-lactamase class D